MIVRTTCTMSVPALACTKNVLRGKKKCPPQLKEVCDNNAYQTSRAGCANKKNNGFKNVRLIMSGITI